MGLGRSLTGFAIMGKSHWGEKIAQINPQKPETKSWDRRTKTLLNKETSSQPWTAPFPRIPPNLSCAPFLSWCSPVLCVACWFYFLKGPTSEQFIWGFFYHCGYFGCLPSPPAPVLWSDQSLNPCATSSQLLGSLVITTCVPPPGAGFYNFIKFGKHLLQFWTPN